MKRIIVGLAYIMLVADAAHAALSALPTTPNIGKAVDSCN